MKNSEVLQNYQKLKKFGESDTSISRQILFARRKNMAKLELIAKQIEDERNSIIRKYGTEDENGNFSAQVSNKDFMEELSALMDYDNEISLDLVSEDLVPESISPSEFDLFAFMIE